MAGPAFLAMNTGRCPESSQPGDFIDAVESDRNGRILDCVALEADCAQLARQPDIRLGAS